VRLRRHPQPASLRVALKRALVRSVVIGIAALAGFAVSGVVVHANPYRTLEARGTTTRVVPDPDVVRTEALMSRYACSTHSLGKAIPAHAIVRDAGTGHVRLVSFDQGWAAYQGRLRGTELVAVCRR